MATSPLHSFIGHPVKGAGRGKGLGTPTLNIDLNDVPKSLAHGIYAGAVVIRGKRMIAAMHFGPSPVFQADVTFEAHILDAQIVDAPDDLTIEIHAYLRAIADFPSVRDLQAQIAQDIERTRAIMRSP